MSKKHNNERNRLPGEKDKAKIKIPGSAIIEVERHNRTTSSCCCKICCSKDSCCLDPCYKALCCLDPCIYACAKKQNYHIVKTGIIFFFLVSIALTINILAKIYFVYDIHVAKISMYGCLIINIFILLVISINSIVVRCNKFKPVSKNVNGTNVIAYPSYKLLWSIIIISILIILVMSVIFHFVVFEKIIQELEGNSLITAIKRKTTPST